MSELKLTRTGRIIHQRFSPNFNERPSHAKINCIVIHYTDYLVFEEFLACHLDPESKLSSHYLINDDGSIYQLVAEEKRAWHAGVSSWKGEENVNNYSIGIELQNGGMTYKEKYGSWPPYPSVQIQALAELVYDLQQRFLIQIDNIVGHNHIAPNRKIDPGPHFDWQDLYKRIQKI